MPYKAQMTVEVTNRISPYDNKISMQLGQQLYKSGGKGESRKTPTRHVHMVYTCPQNMGNFIPPKYG